MLRLAVPEGVGLSSSRLALMEPHLRQYVDGGKIPGCLILVARYGQPASNAGTLAISIAMAGGMSKRIYRLRKIPCSAFIP